MDLILALKLVAGQIPVELSVSGVVVWHQPEKADPQGQSGQNVPADKAQFEERKIDETQKRELAGALFLYGSIIFLTDGCQVTHPSVRFFV